MALSSISAALAQFDANASWYNDQSVAALRLEAIEYLLTHRANQTDQGSTVDYPSLEKMATELRRFLGAGPARAFGRSRRNSVAFQRSGLQ